MKALFVFRLHFGEDAGGIALDRVLQDRGEGRTGVFDIGVDASGEHSLLTDVAPGQEEAALDAEMRVALNLLGGYSAKKALLGKFFRADDDGIGPMFGAP